MLLIYTRDIVKFVMCLEKFILQIRHFIRDKVKSI